MQHFVKATREGLIGHLTATGHILSEDSEGCALPCHHALRRWVRITHGDFETRCQVLDVGPWNTDDDAYVLGDARPQAETGVDRRGRRTNGAGIDLFEGTWRALGMTDNDLVTWEFVDAPLST